MPQGEKGTRGKEKRSFRLKSPEVRERHDVGRRLIEGESSSICCLALRLRKGAREI